MTIPSMNAFSNGPPLLACDNDLLPRHGVDPTDNPLPFFVNTNEFIGQTYIPNQLYRSKYLLHVAKLLLLYV